MTDEWKKRTAIAVWTLLVTLVVAVALRQCMAPDEGRLVAVSADFRDSLLQVDVTECQRIDYSGFSVWFDTAHHVPACVTYELIAGHINGPYQRLDRFEKDDSVAGCPSPNAYRGTGLHHGHMAPATDMAWDSIATRQSFLMTNVCPQQAALNKGGWARLEEKCREWAMRDSALIIATGPILESGLKTMAGPGVAIPRRFYKVVLAHAVSPRRAIAFIYGNEACNGKLERYAVAVDEVESLTGIDFFKTLPDDEEKRIEKACNLQVWLH